MSLRKREQLEQLIAEIAWQESEGFEEQSLNSSPQLEVNQQSLN
jgi:hypothetical protein